VNVIEIRHASYRYVGEREVEAFAGVDLVVPDGAFVSLVGPSGCGKSTLLKAVAGLLAPSAGEVLVRGHEVAGRFDEVAWMPQRDLLLPWRRALDNATLGAQVAHQARAEARTRALELFPRFGLAGFERAWPAELSGGMRQRLALLRTFLLDRDVLLLDEPFGALDALTRREMYAWLQDIWLADRRTVLFVTHDVEEAVYLSDVVHVMSPRPGSITHTVAVGEPRPRAPGFVSSPEFVAAKAELLAALSASGAHQAAMDANEPGYFDPTTGLFVLTSHHLVSRGTCCGLGCRHCPYGADE
jgi:ABC-type nitrate/sulfonate/bicarbonate transport system ATPase subunit